MNTRTAVFPGTFDPLTNGHLDIIDRASKIFSEVVVAVGRNPEKDAVFGIDERVSMIAELISTMPGVRVEAYEGLTVDFVRNVGGNVIIRGIRDGVDLRDELNAANTNLIVGQIETVFLLAAEQFALTSSTFIKQIVAMGGDDAARLSALVPMPVLKRLRAKFKPGKSS